MSCSCASDFEERGRQKFAEKFGDLVNGETTSRMAGVFLLSEDLSKLEHRPSLPVVVEGQVFDKRRTKATSKKLTVQAIASFCPFCGQSLAPKEET